jgi:hypothetical protein
VSSIEAVLNGSAQYHIECGDCLDVVRTIPDCSIDSMVTDPPAGISFMGAAWDGDKGGRDQWIEWLAERLVEAYRVLKPGGYVCIWSLPRTSHWTGKAIEDAGFEIRDTIHHTFGSGFPKSMNVSLAIDNADGLKAERGVVHEYSASGNAGNAGAHLVGVESTESVQLAVTRGATEKSREWDGFGTAMKPGHELWWIARKPFKGTLVANVLEYGCGALNIDTCRVGTDWNEPDRPASWKNSGHTADASADKIAAPPGDGIQCHPGGRWPANVVFTHSAACQAVGSTPDEISSNTFFGEKFQSAAYGVRRATTTTTTTTKYDCAPDCPVRKLDGQSGESVSNPNPNPNPNPNLKNQVYGNGMGGTISASNQHADSGTASRFFNCFEWDPQLDDPFIYLAKPSTAEREAGCGQLRKRSAGEMTGGREEDGAAQDCPRTGAGRGGGRHNHHPTLKSIALMSHLIRLVTRPGGITLSMFLGSGTDVCTGILSGFRCIGIEKEPDFAEIARARARYWAHRGPPSKKPLKPVEANPKQTTLF